MAERCLATIERILETGQTGVHHLTGDEELTYSSVATIVASKVEADTSLIRPTISTLLPESQRTIHARLAMPTLADLKIQVPSSRAAIIAAIMPFTDFS